MSATDETSPDWEVVLSAAARVQQILPDAVLVGGTAAALHADHRLSSDADHVLTDLRNRFDDWGTVKSTCARIADATFEYVCDRRSG